MMYDSSWLYVAMWMKLVLNPRGHISNLVELENKIKSPNWMCWPSQINVTDLYVDGQMGHVCLDFGLTSKERTTMNLHTKLVPLMVEWHCAACLSWVVKSKGAVIMLLSLIHSEHLTYCWKLITLLLFGGVGAGTFHGWIERIICFACFISKMKLFDVFTAAKALPNRQEGLLSR